MFLTEQRAIAIRNRPPTRTQLRNQMMTYLKHIGNKKHSDLKNKTFKEIQALYKKVKRFYESFTTVGSTEDKRKIKEMNEGAKDLEQKRLKKKIAKETPKKEDTAKVPAKVDVIEQSTKKRKGGTMDSEIMERKSVIARLNKVSSPDGDYLVIYRANGNFRAFNCLLEVLHIFDRQDLFHLYDLVMEQYSEITLEGIELILWGDLKIMMESSTEENDQSDFWNDQQDWEIVTWRLYEACGVYILELKDGTVIHMLVERRYPLSKDLLQRMLDLGLEVERESTAALDLIRFIKQQDSGWDSGGYRLKHLKAQIKKLKKKAKPVICTPQSWVKSVSLKKKIGGERKYLKNSWSNRWILRMLQRCGEDKCIIPYFQVASDYFRDPFLPLYLDYFITSLLRSSDISLNVEVMDFDEMRQRYDPQTPPTTTTPSIFGDDVTIAQVLIIMRSLLTLKPLLKIDPKDKGKKKIEEEDESDTEFEGIPEAKKKFKQPCLWMRDGFRKDARKIGNRERRTLRLQDEEREQFIMEERAKFLHDTTAAQEGFLQTQRAIAIRNRPYFKNST
ncbi:hypothetical protein Tco_0889764 [Tanacetum coccineum]